MGIVWSDRIEHVVRVRKRTDSRYMGKAMRSLSARWRRGLPSRNLPFEVVVLRQTLRLARRGILPLEDARALVAKIEWEKLRYRLLERKRGVLAKVRSRRVVADKTCINLWRRRAEWLRLANAHIPGAETSSCQRLVPGI